MLCRAHTNPEDAKGGNFHDLRAKSASDDTLQAATAPLSHGDAATTIRYYRRGVERVRSLR